MNESISQRATRFQSKSRDAQHERPRQHPRVADLTQLFAGYVAEKYTDAARERTEVRGGLPIRQLHKVGDHVSERRARSLFQLSVLKARPFASRAVTAAFESPASSSISLRQLFPAL